MDPQSAPTTVTGEVPDGLLAAFWAYELALERDDLAALDDAFTAGPHALRGDASGVLVGSEQISAFRSGRGGAPARKVRELHVRPLGPDHAAVVSVNQVASGGSGLVTQVWERCADGRWRIAVAQVAQAQPAADQRIWRVVGYPLVPAGGDGADGSGGGCAGMLAGESVAVKDLFSVAGFSVGAGNPTYLADAPAAPDHAPAVRVLIQAGAQIRGIARTDEFAYSLAGTNAHYGTPPNPRAPRNLPGGSSSGPAAAVATGQASIGLGTDTAGSVRVPASYQGLWGLRTTHGAVSRDGLLALAPSFDTVGWLTRAPGLLRTAAEVSLDPDAATRPAGGRFAVCQALLDLVHPGVRAAFDAAVGSWTAAGVLPAVDRVRLPDPASAVQAFRTVQAAEAWREHGAWIAAHPGALGGDVASRFAWALTITARQEAEARALLDQARCEIDEALADAVLLLPATPTPAPPRTIPDADLDAVRAATVTLTCLAAITGRPALSAPLLDLDGAPVGFGLVGPRHSDLDLVALGAALVPAAPRRRPLPLPLP
ncbi:MAG TPA: AtzH-like domain-containing protein [Actinocrinis sp.]|nr:AtzH-like domain-containing protein [Actinocrinis sp.]